MADKIELFKCYNCGLNKRIEFLDSVLDSSGQLLHLKEQIQVKKEELSELNLRYLKDKGVYAMMQKVDRELQTLYKQLSENKKSICKLCRWKGQQSIQVPTFRCCICGETREGKPIELHIDGWEDEKILPQDWSKVCRSCFEEHDLCQPINFKCPRSGSEGFEGKDGSIYFSCWCPQKK